MCCPLNCGFLHHVSRSSLNILWIAYPSSSSDWNTLYLMSFEILKGLYLFWSKFFKSQFKWIFFVSNHMLSPSFSPYRFCLFLLNCFFMASFAISINFFAIFQLSCSHLRKSSSFGNSIFTVRSLFHRCLPKFNLNRVCPVAACFCHCTGILPLMTILSSHSTDSLHNVTRMLQLLG